jgi:hypothetical protein
LKSLTEETVFVFTGFTFAPQCVPSTVKGMFASEEVSATVPVP